MKNIKYILTGVVGLIIFIYFVIKTDPNNKEIDKMKAYQNEVVERTNNVNKKELSESPKNEISYDSLKNNYEFIGRWKMVWTITSLKDQKPVEYEFYNSADKNYWYEVSKNSPITIHKFIRNGDKYTRKPQSDVDYYLITKDGELKSFDNDGFIGPEFGFKYVKMR